MMKCSKGILVWAGNIARPNKVNYVAYCGSKKYDELSGKLSDDGQLQRRSPPKGDLFSIVSLEALGSPAADPQCLSHYYVCLDPGFDRACCKPTIDT